MDYLNRFSLPNGYFYDYDGHNLVRFYDAEGNQLDAFTITRYDYELAYQETAKPYPYDYVRDRVIEHKEAHFVTPW